MLRAFGTLDDVVQLQNACVENFNIMASLYGFYECTDSMGSQNHGILINLQRNSVALVMKRWTEETDRL
jgi:hypothetical protein